MSGRLVRLEMLINYSLASSYIRPVISVFIYNDVMLQTLEFKRMDLYIKNNILTCAHLRNLHLKTCLVLLYIFFILVCVWC